MRKINPPNIIKSKVGSGGVSPHVLGKAEKLIQEGDLGFGDYVFEQLNKLDTSLNNIKNAENPSDDDQHQLIIPIMTLKAHGGMFGYELITKISIEILHLLEHIKGFNDDIYQILAVFKATTKAIIDQNLKDDGGKLGEVLVEELNLACERYFSKH